MINKILIVLVGLLGVIFFIFLASLLFAIPVMLLWNWLMPSIFDIPVLTFWQSWGILMLASLLFGNSSYNYK